MRSFFLAMTVSSLRVSAEGDRRGNQRRHATLMNGGVAWELGERFGLQSLLHFGVNLGVGKALHGDAGGFKVSNAVSVAVAEEDGLAQQHDQAARLFFKESADRGVVVAYEIVGRIAFGAGELAFQPMVEGGFRQLADGVMAGADGGEYQRHIRKGTSVFDSLMKACILQNLPVNEGIVAGGFMP